MKSRKIYQVLSLLPEEDLDSFGKFLASPFFNNRPSMVDFFELWQEKILLQDPLPDPETEDFLSGTDFSPKRMDKMCSELLALLNEFLEIHELRKRPHLREELRFRALNRYPGHEMELVRALKRAAGKVEKMRESPERNFHLMNLEWIGTIVRIRTRETSRLWQEDFGKLHRNLDAYYLLQKLKLSSASINARKIYNQGEKDPGTEFLDFLLATVPLEEISPLARAYYYAARMLRFHGEEDFHELIGLLSEKVSTFAEEEARELYSFALNFCIRKSNQGQEEFLNFAAGLYEQLLDTGLCLENGKIAPQRFKNIVTLFCRIGRTDWTEAFIQQFGKKLIGDPQGHAVRYNEAVLAFHRKEFRKAILLFRELISLLKEDIFYGIDSRVYLWKSYFEALSDLSLEEVDEMYRLYDSFRVFVDRNDKLSEGHKLAFRNFIREFKRFMEALEAEENSRNSLMKVREEVEAMDFLANKTWFLQKLDAELGR